MNAVRRLAMLALAAALAAPPLALAQARPADAQSRSADDAQASPRWQKVRVALFQSRPIADDAGEILALEAPARAEDAAVVPIAIRTRLEQRPGRYIERIYLVIDNNPSPLAATFRFTPDSGRADIETRVRIDEYTHVRAIAETSDGGLHMATRYVKASGGCSAPPAKDRQAALASLGRMRFQVLGETTPGRPALAQLMISHPNDSGLVMDQSSRQYAPAHFVRTVDVRYGERLVLSAELDFSISENPNLRFWFVPRGPGELRAEVVDSKELRFEASARVGAGW